LFDRKLNQKMKINRWIYSAITDGFTRRLYIGRFTTCRLPTRRLFTIAFFGFFIILPIISHAQHNYRIYPDVVYGHKAGMALTYDVFQPVDPAAQGSSTSSAVAGIPVIFRLILLLPVTSHFSMRASPFLPFGMAAARSLSCLRR
jgi:hypothetical protein